MSAPVPGDRIGKYALLGELGRGGMGVVFRARDLELGREVALKLLLAGDGASREQVLRFQNEAQALARLDHAGFVRVMDAGEHAGCPYMVMELVAGEGLDRRLKREGPLPVREVLAQGRALAAAMAHAHERGILHRDLKPANILAQEDGRWRITDFGLAKAWREGERLTRTGQLLGTPAYMPPEQASGEVSSLDERADVYALGATLYALLCGEAPFSGSHLNVIAQVLRHRPERLTRRRPEVGDDLEAVVLECMEKEPADRYASMQALLEDLERVASGRRTAARRQRLRRRQVRTAGAVWLAGVALAAAGVGAWWGLRAAPSEVRAAAQVEAPPPVELELAAVSSVTLAAEVELRAAMRGPGRELELRRGKDCLARGPDLLRHPVRVSLEVGRNAFVLSALDTTHAPRRAELVVYRLRLPAGFRPGERDGEVVCERDGSLLLFHPPGRFVMGWAERDEQVLRRYFGQDAKLLAEKLEARRKNELPRHEVELTRGFLLGKFEVTWRQYRAYCERTGRARPTCELEGRAGFRLQDEMPAAGMTWFEALDYCREVGARLPTEAEWEYAARGGEEGRLFPSGEAFELSGGRRANVEGAEDGFPFLAPVGSFPAGVSRWGCHDLMGNVYEYTSDLKYFYRASRQPQTDPVSTNQDVFRTEQVRAATQEELDQLEKSRSRVQKRGGSWDTPWIRTRSAFRSTHAVNEAEGDLGFRLCLDAW